MALIYFSERLKQLRKEKGLTQAQIASQIGVTRSTLSSYENQSRYPSYEILICLSRIFDVSTDYLLCKDDRRYIDITGLTDEESAAIRQMVYLLKKSKLKEPTE